MASSTPTLPVSLLISGKASTSSAAGDEPQKRSREDWRKAKELEEARKAGTAPAAVDEEGNFNVGILIGLTGLLKYCLCVF